MKKIIIILFSLVMFINVFSEDILVVSECWNNRTNKDESGLYFDILREIYKDTKFNINIKIVPYTRSVKMVLDKEADIYVAAYFEEEQGILWPEKDEAFDFDIVGIAYKKGKVFNKLSDIKDYTVGWIRGYQYDLYMDIPVDIYEVNRRSNGLKMLFAGRIDYFMDAIQDIREVIKKEKILGINVKKAFKLGLYFGFSDNKTGNELLSIYKKRFYEIFQDGTLKKLYKKNNIEWKF